MELFVKAALWARIAMSAAGFFSAVLIRADGAARGVLRALLAALVALNSVLLVLSFSLGPNFPLNHKYDGFITATLTLSIIILLYMKNLKSLTPVAIALLIFIAHAAGGLYGAKFEAVMRLTNKLPMAMLFVNFRDISMMFFGFCASVSVVELIRPGQTAVPAGRMSDALYSPALWGFIFFSFCQLFGSVWALTSSYGDVWLWKQSFLFSAVVWIYYGGLLHTRYIPNWPKKLFPALALIGFIMQVLFLYVYSPLYEVR